MCVRDVQLVPHYERRASETRAIGAKWNRNTRLDLTVGVSKVSRRSECCEKNHVGVFSSCIRPIVSSVLSRMIRVRAISLYAEGKVAEARFTVCFESWWTRELVQVDQSKNAKSVSLEAFKTKRLRWCDYRTVLV